MSDTHSHDKPGLSRNQSTRRGAPGNTSSQNQLMKRVSTRAAISKAASTTNGVAAPTYRYVDILNNQTITSRDPFLDPKRYRRLGDSGLEKVDEETGLFLSLAEKPDFKNFQHLNEISGDPLGLLWRELIKIFILLTWDEVNALRITRTLQFHLFVNTGYEGYILDELLVAFTAKDINRLSYTLYQALRNRNLSRIIVRTIRTTWDNLYHIDSLFKWGKYLDGFQQVFFFTGFGFPASENFVNTRDFTVSVFFRAVFGEGSFITRTFTQGRQALITDDPEVTAQNLAAEVTGFETANRNQHGTYIGRLKTNMFRREHRLPVDESLVRSFQALVLTTTVNNGVEACLSQLARHWHNMLYQIDGNFAHQRMEQINPFQFLRFQMPSFLVALTIHRGICAWDSEVLAPFVTKLQLIKPCDEMHQITKDLIAEFRDNIAVGVCGGIASRVDPLLSLLDAMDKATDKMTEEAYAIQNFIKENKLDFILSNVRVVMTNVDWSLPPTDVLRQAVIAKCKKQVVVGVCPHATSRALNLLSPKDKRTLIELCLQDLESHRAAVLLISRTVTLLQREIRRDRLDYELIETSKGDIVDSDYQPKSAYWITTENGKSDVYIYKAFAKGSHIFENRLTRNTVTFHGSDVFEVRHYVDIAELISLAQWVFMKIELDYGKKFNYSGLMEYNFIREQLRFLICVSQIQSYVIDEARLNRYQTIQNGNYTEVAINELVPGDTYYYLKNKQYEEFHCPQGFNWRDPKFEFLKTVKIVTVPPQNMIIIGGGPTGLLGTLHCLENVLISNGTMTLYESRDAFTKGGASFERSQIVRLDSRWIAMLRYHLGTVYEDVFVPATGETDSHFGNQLPFQGFIEITIKDMEAMLHIGVSMAASRDLLHHFSNATTTYDYDSNKLIKLGRNLVPGDLILRNIDANGQPTSEVNQPWQVTELIDVKPISIEDIALGQEVVFTGIYSVGNSFTLQGKNLVAKTFHFQNVANEEEVVVLSTKGNQRLPTIYPKGTNLGANFKSIIVEHVLRGDDGAHVAEELDYKANDRTKFVIDIGSTHVCTAIGKPHDHHHHFEFCTTEPYGVCCLSGIKVSMLMHNFGTRRWTTGIIDDFRSGVQNDQNTRIVGDFTKVVNSKKISVEMVRLLNDDPNFRLHFTKIAEELKFETSKSYFSLLLSLVEIYRDQAPYERHHLQTRFFETGDNFYIGMEFTREYDTWKESSVNGLVALLVEENNFDKAAKAREIERLHGTIAHNIDRLWYQATLNVIKTGDVYNPSGSDFLPDLVMLDNSVPTELRNLKLHEAFRLYNVSPELAFKRFEVLSKPFNGDILVRDHEGFVSELNPGTMVLLGSNLTRGPDGATESRVSIATFPVGHLVNHRTMRLSSTSKGYAVAFFGDEQSSPHFMRYSGLTGAAINVMLFDNYINNILNDVPIKKAYAIYSASTRWSNGEVVQRGINSNYGEDSFLRPGFPYADGIRYLYDNIIEHSESGQDMQWVLSRDWKIRWAAGLIPRGMENNKDFLDCFIKRIQKEIFDFVLKLQDAGIAEALKARKKALDSDEVHTLESRSTYWSQFIDGLDLSPEVKHTLNSRGGALFMIIQLEIIFYLIIDQAQVLKKYGARISSQTLNQPPSLDAFIDDFAVEAIPTTNILVQASTFAAISLAVGFRSHAAGAVFSAIFWWYSIGTISNTNRYKNRNEDYRIMVRDEKYVDILKGVFAVLNPEDRLQVPAELNPFLKFVDKRINIFLKKCKYYNIPKPNEFLKMYKKVLKKPNDEATIRAFMRSIATKFIVEELYESSYIQENLVNVYSALEELARSVAPKENIDPEYAPVAKKLFNELLVYESRLESSLQRGAIKFGAFKQKEFKHNHLFTILLYFRNLIWFAIETPIRKFCCSWYIDKFVSHSAAQPLAAETWEIIKQLEALSEHMPETRRTELRREIVDMTSLYYATMESYASSFVIISGMISFTTSSGFIVANAGIAANPHSINWIRYARVSSFSVGIFSPITSISAAWYLYRQFRILLSSCANLSKKRGETTDPLANKNLGDCLFIVYFVTFITFFRSLASLGAAAGLPFALAASLRAAPDASPALWLAISSIGVQLLCNVLLFYIEYNPLYNLPPKLGEFIGVAFGDELQELKKSFTIPPNDIESAQAQEKTAWLYVAQAFCHKYRFDSAFGANRFGGIWQYILSGCQLRTNGYKLVLLEDNPDNESYIEVNKNTKRKNVILSKYKFGDNYAEN